jgi:hypothetical protein
VAVARDALELQDLADGAVDRQREVRVVAQEQAWAGTGRFNVASS